MQPNPVFFSFQESLSPHLLPDLSRLNFLQGCLVVIQASSETSDLLVQSFLVFAAAVVLIDFEIAVAVGYQVVVDAGLIEKFAGSWACFFVTVAAIMHVAFASVEVAGKMENPLNS